jgi:hypothetical protein
MGKHDETSVWKKEISFRKKPKQAPKAEPVWPQEAAHAASATPDAKGSVWKKEISFGRKSKPRRRPCRPPLRPSRTRSRPSGRRRSASAGRRRPRLPRPERPRKR